MTCLCGRLPKAILLGAVCWSLALSSASGDEITLGDIAYMDVLVYESSTSYYVRFPESGKTLSVPRADVPEGSVRISDDPYVRDDLKATYQERSSALAASERSLNSDYAKIFSAENDGGMGAEEYYKAVAAATPFAPELLLREILKEGPVAAQPGSVYVVEFWATWCGPCRKSIPHLTAMQAKYASKGVAFVGITRETAAEARPFVNEMGAKMNYTVATDAGSATSRAYGSIWGVNTIPHAYIVDEDGKIAWHGHPKNRQFEAMLDLLTG